MNDEPRAFRRRAAVVAAVLAALATASPTHAEEEKPVVADAAPPHVNRLQDASSPYLLQHAHNPVDWYPWGEEALEKARTEDKPIFLSIGYSACHWCHVMAHESFENEAVAAYLNEHFVNIKVDREERPDLDDVYMAAVQIMTGGGGWPMSVWLTPDLKPFYAGTYFPPRDMYGRPGFRTVLESIVKTWQTRRDAIEQSAEQVTGYIRQSMASRVGDSEALTPDLLRLAADDLANSYDAHYGGFGPAPKFPSAPSIQVLLRQFVHSGDERLRDMAVHTLRKMASGGLYDQLRGGFHRYSVDEQWLVPHFEKMLYDNAQLVQAYLEAYQLTREPLFRRVVRETLAYVLRDMRDEAGGFYSAEDADSEGEEGKFYTWTRDDLERVLGSADAHVFCTYYGVRPGGNFASHEPYHENQNILHVPRPPEVVASELDMPLPELEERLADMRARLLDVRAKRVRPGRDDKVLASWNALMISAFAQAYSVLGDDAYREAAERAADFVLGRMVDDGRLQHAWRNGRAQFPAYLDDYAFLAVALVDLYEATFDPRRLDEADRLVGAMREELWDDAHGGFYFTGEAHKHLIARNKPVYDGAEPSGNSMATLALLRLAKLRDNADFATMAKRILEANHANMKTSPRAYLKMLVAADFYLEPTKEIAIAGNAGSPDVKALLDTVYTHFLPNKVLAFIDRGNGNAESIEKAIPLLAGKTPVEGKAAAYVCRDFTCRQPVTTPGDLAAALDTD